MVMSIHKLTAGDGYRYLTQHIAGGDIDRRRGQSAEDYYTAEGNPPGRWLGRGVTAFNLTDLSVVREDQMRALYGEGLHPEADAIIARYQTENIKAGMSEAELREVVRQAHEQAQLGTPFPQYVALAPFEDRVRDRLAAVAEQTGREPTATETARIRVQEARRQRHAVAGFDLVFTPVKSVSLLWALHPDPTIRAAVRQAHDDAITATLTLLEEHAAFTRTGKGGIAQINTNGLVATAFDHYDSRDGDPNLHTHLVVSNKIQGIDGLWRALDARAIYAMTVAASEHYNTTLQTLLTNRLHLGFAARQTSRSEGKQPIWEIDGIPTEWIHHFSRRRSAIGPRYEELLAQYRHEHGRDPGPSAAHQLARQATLETRQGKKPPTSLAAKRDTWTGELLTKYGHRAMDLLSNLTAPNSSHLEGSDATGSRSPGISRTAPHAGRQQARPYDIPTVHQVADLVIAEISEQRSTWTIWNLHAATQRFLRDPAITTHIGTGNRTSTDDASGRARSRSVLSDGDRPVSAFTTVEDLAEAVLARAVSPAKSIDLSAPNLLPEPDRLRRKDKESVFTVHAANRYTSRAVLDAEERLLNAAQAVPRHKAPTNSAEARAAFVPSPAGVAAALDGFEAVTGKHLDDGQRHLVTQFVTDPRRLVVGIGAAGTGKTTAMQAYLYVLTTTGPRRDRHTKSDASAASGRRLIALATSAKAAAVLGQSLGVTTENVHKFLEEHHYGHYAKELAKGVPRHHLPRNRRHFAVRPGDVILVDEAGMAGTRNLDRLLSIATAHGASLRLLGDHRQLAAVESGGALRLIAGDVGAVELITLHRFADPAEAQATLQLRIGDTAGLDFYTNAGRIQGGSTSAMIEAAYTGWYTDMRAGLTTFMPAATNSEVVALSARARLDRVAAGQVEPAGVELHDGNHAGRGDWIVTRRNERRLPLNRGRDWVRNGDAWHVLARHKDGSLLVRHLDHHGQIRLPTAYVHDDVELLYASTVHRGQGGTVDTAHPLITQAMTREHLYVAATRGRHRTNFYVATHDVLPLDDDERLDATRHDPDAHQAREILEDILTREGAERSATETIRDTLNTSTSLATLIPRYQHADSPTARVFADEYEEVVTDVFTYATADSVLADPDWPDLVRALRRAQLSGWPAELILRAAGTQPLVLPDPAARVASTNAGDSPAPEQIPRDFAVASRLAVAVDAIVQRQPAPAPVCRPTVEQATRYAALVTALTNAEDGELTPGAARRNPLPRTAAQISLIPTAPPPGRQQYGDLVGQALGSKLAGRAIREAAWPALQSALYQAEDNGYDPATLLRIHTNRRDLNRTFSVSEALAWRIHRHLIVRAPSAHDGDVNPAGIPVDPALSTDNAPINPFHRDETWRAIAWMLAGHESAGGKAADLLPAQPTAVPTDGDSIDPTTLADLKQSIHERAQRAASTATRAWRLPTWMAPPASDGEAYLHSAARVVGDRMQHLARAIDSETQAWAEALGPKPTDTQTADRWQYYASIAAAYRELNDITDDDPTHPIGPYIEPDQPGHHEYWHAAAAILTAHDISQSENPYDHRHNTALPVHPDAPNQGTGTIRASNSMLQATLAHRIATDTYRALPQAERHTIATGVVTRLGNLWFGSDADTDIAITRPVYATQLQAALSERGHLSASNSGPSASPEQPRTAGKPARRPLQQDHAPGTKAAPRPKSRPVTSQTNPTPHPQSRPDPIPFKPPQSPREQGPRPRW